MESGHPGMGVLVCLHFSLDPGPERPSVGKGVGTQSSDGASVSMTLLPRWFFHRLGRGREGVDSRRMFVTKAHLGPH